MNKQRRKEIEKAQDIILEAKDMLESAMEEEQDAYDNLPESIQDSERGEEMQSYIDILQEVVDNLYDVYDQIGEVL